MTIYKTALFTSFFLEALKPEAIRILEAGCAIADSLVSASTRMDVQTSVHKGQTCRKRSTTKVNEELHA
jgi:hypothetical protein